MQKLFDCNCTVPLMVRDSLCFKRQIGEACQVADSPYFAIRGIEEGAQRNVEIAYCICTVPFQVRDSLHCSGKLVRLMLGSNSGNW